MKNIFTYIAILVIGMTFSSCSEEAASPMADSPMLTIHLNSSSLQTKAPVEGVTALNENWINTIHYFLYPVGKTNENALIHSQTPITTSKQNLESFSVPLDETLLSQLFVYPQETCKVFLIVNLPAGTVIPSDTSIDNLKEIAVEADFSSLPVGSFVMTGEGDATLQSRTQNPAATGTIGVDRVASKITLNITTNNTYVDGGVTWTSRPKDMKVSLYNCVNNAELSGIPVETPSYFDIINRTFAVTTGVDVSECTCDPFYSYPVEWTPGSEDEPYFFIMLPWSDGTGYKSCYYKVILSDTRLESNNWYNINLALSVIGSFNEQEPTVVVSNANYYVVNWGDATDSASDNLDDVNADIHGARYLVVDQDVYELNNQNTISIPFTTSHPCEIVDMSTSRVLNQATITRPDYSKANAVLDASYAWNSSTWSLRIEGNNIVFNHNLNNDLSSRSIDYAPYTIKFTIRHADDPSTDHDITIIQYPAMIIEADQNRKLDPDDYGGTYIDGEQGEDAPYTGTFPLSGAFTVNPNMYVIETTTLSQGSDLVIGDPRSIDVNNLGVSFSSAKGIEDLDGANRTLRYYYPTLASAETKNMIAPKFRIASSHGVCRNGLSYAQAQARCASYQEDGYPAGRWRVPTYGEIRFMVTLSTYGIIPSLFSGTVSYWYAGGYVRGDMSSDTPGTNTGNNVMVRCVYDEWYWGNSQYPRMPGNNIDFAWGDAER